jgi:hypothetical protein
LYPKRSKQYSNILWVVECVCGLSYEVHSSTLQIGKSNPCSCKEYREWPWKWDRSKTDFVPERGNSFDDLTGIVSGTLTCEYPIGRNKGRILLWHCSCTCGGTYVGMSNRLKRGREASCGCLLRGATHFGWSGYGEIPGKFYSKLKRAAFSRNHTVEISIEYLWDLFLAQNRNCALSGVPLQFLNEKGCVDITASLDRINSNLSYVEGNLQWVHKHVNLMKNVLDQPYFLEMCAKITALNKEI